jgi:hypothetical protein
MKEGVKEAKNLQLHRLHFYKNKFLASGWTFCWTYVKNNDVRAYLASLIRI